MLDATRNARVGSMKAIFVSVLCVRGVRDRKQFLRLGHQMKYQQIDYTKMPNEELMQHLLEFAWAHHLPTRVCVSILEAAWEGYGL